MISQHKDLTSQHKDLTSDGRNMPPYIPVSFDSAYLYHLTKRTCIIAASEPAATPAEVNPAPAKTAGAATTAAAPTPAAVSTTDIKNKYTEITN